MSKIAFTDHAIVRYLERCYGMDVEAIKDEMFSPRVQAAIAKMGSGKFPTAIGGCKAVIKDRVVITVTPS